jgi:hypothetical protein
LDLATIFYCPSFETSLFVASYDSQGHGGGIRPRLHTVYLFSFQSQSQSYFTTGGLPPINLSWRQVPWDSWPEFFFYPQLNPFVISPYVTSSLTRRWVQLPWSLVLLKTPRHGTQRKHLSQQFFYCCIRQLSHGPRREHSYPVSPLVHVKYMLPSNGFFIHSHYLATGLHAPLYIHSRPIHFLRPLFLSYWRKSRFWHELWQGFSSISVLVWTKINAHCANKSNKNSSVYIDH